MSSSPNPVEMVRRLQAEKVLDHVTAHPGLTSSQIADAVFHGKRSIFDLLSRDHWLDAEARKRNKAFVWVPRARINGTLSPYYGWMATRKLALVHVNVLWRHKHIRTRMQTLRDSSALDLMRSSRNAESIVLAGSVDGEAAMMASQDATMNALIVAANAELARLMAQANQQGTI